MFAPGCQMNPLATCFQGVLLALSGGSTRNPVANVAADQ
jgi:hypothetical protein